MSTTDIGKMNAVKLLNRFRDKKRLSPVEVTEDALLRIERYNPAVNAYCHRITRRTPGCRHPNSAG